MSDTAIRVRGASKKYQIGKSKAAHRTLRETIADGVKSPIRRIRSFGRASYGEQDVIWALDDVSFDVREGEVVGIIGRNGSGKSTLLKILSRITEPTCGRVEITGRVGALLEVGTGFHQELTGRENVYLNGAILGMTRREIEKRFDEIVQFSGVEKFIDTPVKRYSSGMRVRLGFAVAAHLDPEILLIDEVLAVGDAQFRGKCLSRISDLGAGGRAVLFVSHNMHAIQALCDRVLLLNDGHIVCDGPTAEALAEYSDVGDGPRNARTWSVAECPGGKEFRLVSVVVRNLLGESSSTLRISEGGMVEIEYEVLQEGSRAQFSLILQDSVGSCVFGSLSNTERDYHGKPMRAGMYRSTCYLPGDLLNAGKFHVSIAAFSGSWIGGFKVEKAVSFQAIDDGVLSEDYTGQYGGPIRPRLRWKTEEVVEDSRERERCLL